MKLLSSWISSIIYRRTPDGQHYLILFTTRDEALLWRGQIPSYLPGLIQAGTGGKSVGHAFGKLKRELKDCEYQRITDHKQVRELKEMMQ